MTSLTDAFGSSQPPLSRDRRRRRAGEAAGGEAAPGPNALSCCGCIRRRARCGGSSIRSTWRSSGRRRAPGTEHDGCEPRGKTYGVGGYETLLHLTGRYPDCGRVGASITRLRHGGAGDTGETTRESCSRCYSGKSTIWARPDTGGRHRGEPSRRAGITGAIDTAAIRHRSGGTSLIGFKSYDPGARNSRARRSTSSGWTKSPGRCLSGKPSCAS